MKTLTSQGGFVAPVIGLAAVCFASAAHSQTNVNLYGVVDMALESAQTGRGHLTRVESGLVTGSRWGLRGTEDLGGGLRALFVAESGFNADSGVFGQGGLAFGRQAFVGLAGDWGQLTAGRHYTTFHTALATYSLTGLIWGNAANYFRDGTALRADNMLRYQSPVWNGWTVRAMTTFGEQVSSTVGNQYGGSVDYASGPWAGGVSWLHRRTAGTNSDRYGTAGIAYDFKLARASLLMSIRRDELPTATSNEGRFFEASMTIPVLGTDIILLSYGEYSGQARDRTDARAISLRYDHYLSKRTLLYAGASRISNQAAANFVINTASNAGPAGMVGGKPSSIVAGISHSF